MASRGFPPELANSLEWTFVSDRASLDGASRDQLRDHFRAWAAEAEKAEQSRGTIATDITAQRYGYFIQVDEEALRSVVDGDANHCLGEGQVNIVRCGEFDLGPEAREGDREHVEVEDGDEGWMVIAAHMVGPDFYDSIGQLPQDWWAFYTPPPRLVYW